MPAASRLHPKKSGRKLQGVSLQETSRRLRGQRVEERISRSAHRLMASDPPPHAALSQRPPRPPRDQAELRLDAGKVRQLGLVHCHVLVSFCDGAAALGAPIRGDGQGGPGSPGVPRSAEPALVQVPSKQGSYGSVRGSRCQSLNWLPCESKWRRRLPQVPALS